MRKRVTKGSHFLEFAAMKSNVSGQNDQTQIIGASEFPLSQFCDHFYAEIVTTVN